MLVKSPFTGCGFKSLVARSTLSKLCRLSLSPPFLMSLEYPATNRQGVNQWKVCWNGRPQVGLLAQER